MSKLTEENKGKIVCSLMKGDDINKICEENTFSKTSVNNFVKKLKESLGENSAKEDPIQYGEYVLNLIEEGYSEEQAYYMVFSSKLEDEYTTVEEFEKCLKAKDTRSRPQVHKGRAVTMTDTASQNDKIAARTRETPSHVHKFK